MSILDMEPFKVTDRCKKLYKRFKYCPSLISSVSKQGPNEIYIFYYDPSAKDPVLYLPYIYDGVKVIHIPMEYKKQARRNYFVRYA